MLCYESTKRSGLEAKTSGGTLDLFAAAPADTASLFIQKRVDTAATQEPWGYVIENRETENCFLIRMIRLGHQSTNTVVAARATF